MSIQQQQQARRALQKDAQPVISRFLWALRSAALALQRRRCTAALLIQDEFRGYLERAGPAVHTMRQRRKVQRRNFLVSVDAIIRAVVDHGRRNCADESRERRALFMGFISAVLADWERRELAGRRAALAEEEAARQQLLQQLLANVPHEAVPGTLEYDEFQARCHVLRLEQFQRSGVVQASISPKADIIDELEAGRRKAFAEQELQERIELLRAARAEVAAAAMYDVERLETRLRDAMEQERCIAVSGLVQTRALTSTFLLLGPGAHSEHDERVALYVAQEDAAELLWARMWEERTMLLCSHVVAEEQRDRGSRRGIPALEAHERCQIVVRLYGLRLMLLQGEFSSNDGLYVASEAGSRRAIRWAEQRERDGIYRAAAATIFVALVPIEEARARERVLAAEGEQAYLLLHQKLPAYFQQVLEPGARRGIFRDWVTFARQTTLGMFAVTLQALEESGRALLARAAVVQLEHLAGAEYLQFLELKHRALVVSEGRSRLAHAAAAAAEKRRWAAQADGQRQKQLDLLMSRSDIGDPVRFAASSAALQQYSDPASIGPSSLPPPLVVQAAERMSHAPPAAAASPVRQASPAAVRR